jgi:hypothetical protein
VRRDRYDGSGGKIAVRALYIGLIVVVVAAGTSVGVGIAQTPEFRQGFRVLADHIPHIVGEPIENEWHSPTTGDTLQRTTTGLMVWRKADNWTAFTNGYRTWINGPHGVQPRLNIERFNWESTAPTPASPDGDSREFRSGRGFTSGDPRLR